jgi:hypothetical protein
MDIMLNFDFRVNNLVNLNSEIRLRKYVIYVNLGVKNEFSSYTK